MRSPMNRVGAKIEAGRIFVRAEPISGSRQHCEIGKAMKEKVAVWKEEQQGPQALVGRWKCIGRLSQRC